MRPLALLSLIILAGCDYMPTTPVLQCLDPKLAAKATPKGVWIVGDTTLAVDSVYMTWTVSGKRACK